MKFRDQAQRIFGALVDAGFDARLEAPSSFRDGYSIRVSFSSADLARVREFLEIVDSEGITLDLFGSGSVS
jgi:hypothetical protein